MKVLIVAFYQENATVGAFSVIVKTDGWFAALFVTLARRRARARCLHHTADVKPDQEQCTVEHPQLISPQTAKLSYALKLQLWETNLHPLSLHRPWTLYRLKILLALRIHTFGLLCLYLYICVEIFMFIKSNIICTRLRPRPSLLTCYTIISSNLTSFNL